MAYNEYHDYPVQDDLAFPGAFWSRVGYVWAIYMGLGCVPSLLFTASLGPLVRDLGIWPLIVWCILALPWFLSFGLCLLAVVVYVIYVMIRGRD